MTSTEVVARGLLDAARTEAYAQGGLATRGAPVQARLRRALAVAPRGGCA